MGYLLSFDQEDLSIQCFENMLKQLNPNSPMFTVDLRKIRFIDPFGLVSLLLLAKWLNTITPDLFYVIPENLNVNTYLERMKFWEQIENYAFIYPLPNIVKKRSTSSNSDVLLELVPIKDEDDVGSAVGLIMDKMKNLISKNLQISSEITTKFCICLAEVCQNIPQHSHDWGYAAAQTYFYKGQPFIKMAVGDLGIGIRTSLWGNNDLDWRQDRKAIVSALELGVSRYSDLGRGLGLSQVKKYVDQFKGRMQIRSGQARLYFNQQKMFSFKTPFFPGTQISIDLPGTK